MTKIIIDPGHNPTGNDTGAVGYGLNLCLKETVLKLR